MRRRWSEISRKKRMGQSTDATVTAVPLGTLRGSSGLRRRCGSTRGPVVAQIVAALPRRQGGGALEAPAAHRAPRPPADGKGGGESGRRALRGVMGIVKGNVVTWTVTVSVTMVVTVTVLRCDCGPHPASPGRQWTAEGTVHPVVVAVTVDLRVTVTANAP